MDGEIPGPHDVEMYWEITSYTSHLFPAPILECKIIF